MRVEKRSPKEPRLRATNVTCGPRSARLQDPTNELRVEERYGRLRVDDILDAEKYVEVILGRLIWPYIGKLTP